MFYEWKINGDGSSLQLHWHLKYTSKLTANYSNQSDFLQRKSNLYWIRRAIKAASGNYDNRMVPQAICCTYYLTAVESAMVSKMSCWIWDSHRSDHEEYCLLGRDAIYSDRTSQAFRRNVLPQSSVSKNKTSKQPVFLSSLEFGLLFSPEDWVIMFLRNIG
jgi:hypothetical protein